MASYDRILRLSQGEATGLSSRVPAPFARIVHRRCYLLLPRSAKQGFFQMYEIISPENSLRRNPSWYSWLGNIMSSV